MIKFFDSNENIIDYSEFFNVGESSLPLVKELINHEDYTQYSFTVGESEEKISMSDVFILQVNIKDSSSIYTAFKLEKFPKDEIINKTALLKDIIITDVESSKHKTSELFKILKEYQPYFIIYQSKNGIPLYDKEINEMLSLLEMNEISFFYINRELSKFGEKVVAKEESVEEKPQETASIVEEAPVLEQSQKTVEQVEEAPLSEPQEEAIKAPKEKPVKEKKPKNKIDFKKYVVMDVTNIKKNKYHFIFLTVSSFLFGFAASVGFCNAMIGKPISALFFVCAGVGIFLNTYVFIDYFKEFKFRDRLFVYSIIFEIIGYGLSAGATFIFYSLDKGEINANVNASLLAGVGAAMSVAMIILSISIAYLVDFIERKIKAKKALENESK